MPVIASGPNVFLEAFQAGWIFLPLTGLGSGSTVVQVVINVDRRRVRRNTCLAHGNEAAASRIHDVVLERIVLHVVLHLELTRSRPRRIVFEKRVVDHRAMLGAAALGIITPDRYTRGVGVIDQIIARSDVAGGSPLMFTR